MTLQGGNDGSLTELNVLAYKTKDDDLRIIFMNNVMVMTFISHSVSTLLLSDPYN